MKLIVGLGNPGLRYRNTRHNIGFRVIEDLSKKLGISVKKRKYKGLLGQGRFGGEKVILFMPETYMNLSGEAVKEASRKEKIDTKDMLVVCDDINLKLGFIRLRKSGSSGGHKGLESIINLMRSDGFARLRIGINRDKETEELAQFVLSPFNSAERSLLKGIINSARECVIQWMEGDPDRAMTMFNKRQ